MMLADRETDESASVHMYELDRSWCMQALASNMLRLLTKAASHAARATSRRAVHATPRHMAGARALGAVAVCVKRRQSVAAQPTGLQLLGN